MKIIQRESEVIKFIKRNIDRRIYQDLINSNSYDNYILYIKKRLENKYDSFRIEFPFTINSISWGETSEGFNFWYKMYICTSESKNPCKSMEEIRKMIKI